jgi:hypothetical protein
MTQQKLKRGNELAKQIQEIKHLINDKINYRKNIRVLLNEEIHALIIELEKLENKQIELNKNK